MKLRSAYITLLLLSIPTLLLAQFDYKVLDHVSTERQWRVNFSEAADQLQIGVTKNQVAAPEVKTTAAAVKAQLDAQRERKYAYKSKISGDVYESTPESIHPELGENFNGKPFGSAGVPNDNTLAVSNDGVIISAINTTVTILDSEGTTLRYATLSSITKGALGLLDRYYDPKVLYDPVADRFILVFLEGSNSSDTRIIIGFTQSSDPTQDWNFYQINGKPLGGNTWSDYPIIAHNKEDVFITVNLLRDNESWQEGFVESFIWQVNKADGYQGDTLGQRLYHDITYNNKSVWSICPVQPADDLEQTQMYFLSVRPGAASNDTVFMHRIDNTFRSGKAKLSMEVLRSNMKYGVPPSAFQSSVGYRLQTNDTRVLSATLFNNSIHYVQTTLVPEKLSSGVYHAVIRDLDTEPNIRARIIENDILDLAYPSISFTGYRNPDQHSMMITFSHSGELDYPGTSAVFYDGVGELDGIYSDILRIKDGDGLINTFLADSIERWGDYTDIQRRYNQPGTLWLAGSYGDANNRNNVWIAEVKTGNDLQLVNSVVTYPNPAYHSVRIAANFDEEMLVDLRLTDMQGKVVKELKAQQVYVSATEFMIVTTGMANGQYVLSIHKENGDILHSEKVIVNSFQ